MPKANNIPKSYNVMVKKYKKNINANKFEICLSCCEKLMPKQKTCNNLMCATKSNLKNTLTKWKCDIIIFNFEQQLLTIYQNHIKLINDYKNTISKLNREDRALYDCKQDTISLILFLDGASFNKTGKNGTIWSMFGMLLDLKIPERYQMSNMLTIFLIGASNPNLNEFLSKYMKKLDDLIINGLEINQTKLKIKIAGFIADAPAIAKALNINQYNGSYGCIKCLSPGEHLDGRRIYEYSKNIINRSNETYLQQVEEAKRIKQTFQGVKGEAYLAKFIDIPDHVIFDYMHTTCIGTLEDLLNLWLFTKTNSKNENNPWYLSIIS